MVVVDSQGGRGLKWLVVGAAAKMAVRLAERSTVMAKGEGAR